MKEFLIILLYRTLLPLIFIFAFPGWVVKMIRRGGFGSGLNERIGIYSSAPEFEPCGAVHFHAVSVGETILALKLLREWRAAYPDTPFVIATGTSTGHDMAMRSEIPDLRVTYSPLDFPWMVRNYLKRFEPSRIILIEGDIWPNLLRIANKSGIPVSLANARMSPRSARRFIKFAPFVRPFFSMLSAVCIQDEEHRAIWSELGIAEKNIHLTGSIKFDPQSARPPALREDFAEMLAAFGKDRSFILAASTFPGEEVLLASAIRSASPTHLPIIVPRHAERRSEVSEALTSADFNVTLRSNFQIPTSGDNVFVIDSTGELAAWTTHADVVIIGKSFLSTGGQNPSEAIRASKPLIVGPHMENFQPLVTDLHAAKALLLANNEPEIIAAIHLALDRKTAASLTENASRILSLHKGASRRHLAVLHTEIKPA